MLSLNNINSVARYEVKTLRRSWLFRLFTLGALFILGVFNLAALSPIGDQDWALMAIPASLPQVNLYMLNIAQALIIIFLASDFLKRDKKLDTNEVLYTRPMSNFEYVIGKTWGILRLFLGLNFIILLLCLVINITAKNTAIDISAYFTHLLIISIPTLIFSLGLAYILMSVIRNQAITFLLLLGYAALNMFYLWFRAGSLFDYMLFGMPVLKSTIVGYDNLSMIIAHRLLYTSLGLAFILISILIFKRLPQSKPHAILSVILLSASLAVAGFSGSFFYKNYISEKRMREEVIEVNRIYENELFATVTKADIDLKHNGEKIEGTSDMRCFNSSNGPLEKLLFSLNPGLIVSEVLYNGLPATYTTHRHIVNVTPPAPLAAGDSCNLTIKYGGEIIEAYSYPYYSGNIKDDPYTIDPLQVNKRQAFLTEDYLLLTPESGWYPIASLNFFPSNPARIKVDFSDFTLKVTTANDLVPVSQGKQSSDGESYVFTNSTPLTGITLAIGKYLRDTISVANIEYSVWFYEGHDYYKNDLTEIGDTLSLLIEGIMDELSNNFSAEYPFDKLQLVEVPIQFHSLGKKNTQTRSEVQPSMILLPEKLATVTDAGFYRVIKRQKRRMERSNTVVTDKELQVRAFNAFLRNTFIAGSSLNLNNGQASAEPGRYLLGPSFYFFKNNFYSLEYPAINAVFESHLQKVQSMNRNFARGFLGGLSENDKANNILNDKSLKDLLATDPSNDTLRIVLTTKGDYLFNLFRYKAGISEFNSWFKEYLEINKFRNVEIGKFSDDLQSRFGFNLDGIIEPWFEGKGQPGFYFTDIIANEVVVNNRTRYKVSFVASNPEPVGGLFNVTIRSGGGQGMGGRGGDGGSISITIGPGGRGNITGGGMGRGMQTFEIDRIVWLGPGEAKRVSIIKDAEPRGMSINTIFSINNPGELTLPFEGVVKDKNVTASEGEELLASIPSFFESNEIVVDNEDPGFTVFEATSSSRLKNWLNISRENRNNYNEMFSWWAPEYWQKTIQAGYYGMYVKSASYTRSGTGERYVTWTTPITGPGYYDIYTYIGKMGGNRMTMGRGRDESSNSSYHYIIQHDEGEDEITLDYNTAENGWNHLGSYYLSPDSAKVSLSNLSEGRTVTADAIKWVKQNSNK